jgi:hypothetical protein
LHRTFTGHTSGIAGPFSKKSVVGLLIIDFGQVFSERSAANGKKYMYSQTDRITRKMATGFVAWWPAACSSITTDAMRNNNLGFIGYSFV